MSAVIFAGMTLLELAQLLSALAGGTLAATELAEKFSKPELVQQIETHRAAHPEDWDRVTGTHPQLTDAYAQMSQLESESGA